MAQPKFCYFLNSYTLKNQDCTGCNKCGYRNLEDNG